MDNDEEYGVGFLYKAMRERDPKKRKVKPVDKHLLQLDFGGLEDSSDDSDYEVADAHDDDSEPDSDVSDSSGTSDSSDSSASEEAANEENQSGNEELTVGDLLANLKTKSPKDEEHGFSSAPPSVKLRLRICSVCLGDYSEEDDEIVECDCCGITVHEGCYGVSENQSVGSTVSSASTEPWFCDACKAGVKPHCELCPNFGGIYKETDAGKWVHVVCALYIPGVAFGDVDLLSPVTLLEMPYSKWGARECDLCEDARFSRTGVAIGCDAGMCRNYFHVTCAQREGLLSEASPDEDIADPFYAYCKQHAEKNGARMKRRNFLAVQSNCKKPEEKAHGSDMDYKEKARVERKLNGHRQKYQVSRANRSPTWVPSEKLPRLLTTSPSAMRRLLRKAELLGISTQMSATQKTDIRKKWHVAPAFSVDFISYYLDRNVRMKNAKVHLKDHLQQKEKLDKQERILRSKYDKLNADVEKLNKQNATLRSEAEKLLELLGKINGKPLPTPKFLRPKRSPKKKKDSPKPPPTVIHSCGICNRSHNQHLLAHCDTCKKYYHLGCVDPPLTRMPKKTKLMGWQCSECDSSESDDSDANEGVDTNAPRKLRESHQIKLPAKFTPPPKEIKKEAGVTKDRKGKRKRKKSKKLLQAEGDEEEKEMPVLKKEKPIRVREIKPMKPRDVRTQCCVCLQSGDNNNLVRCDECLLCYHFGCLDPPLKKSPKQRGYAWHCTACDPTESDEVDDDDDDDDDDKEDEREIHDIEGDEEPLEPPKLEKVAEDGERSKGKNASSTGKSTAHADSQKTRPTPDSATSEPNSASPCASQSSKQSSAATTKPAASPVTPKRKTATKDKNQETGSVVTSESPPNKTKAISHDVTVYHVSQESSNCTPLAALKPIASSTPELCYTGTEDIIPKNGGKTVKSKKKSCSKKDSKSSVKHKVENIDLDVSLNKQTKKASKKQTNKAGSENCSFSTEMENKNTEEGPVKKRKRTKKSKVNEVKENADHIGSEKSEVSVLKKSKKKIGEDVKIEPAMTEVSNNKFEKAKSNVTKKKRKTSADDNDSNVTADSVVARKKVKTDKKNGLQEKGPNVKKKKGQVKAELLDSTNSLNASVEKEDDDSLDLSSMLVNKKPTAEALALQATVEKLQGRLTPTLNQGTNSSNGNSNGRNIETLGSILPKLVSSRPEKLQSADESNEPHGSDKVIDTGVKNKIPSNTPLLNVPLNPRKLSETPKATTASTKSSNTVTDKPISCNAVDSQNAILDLSNKDSTADGSKSVHLTSKTKESLVQPISHVNSLGKTNMKAVNKADGAATKLVDSQSKQVTEEQKEVDSVKGLNLSKSNKKDKAESAIERFFQKRDTNSGSSGVKKQRVEKTIDMLLAKKEKGVDQTENDQSVTENLHQKSVNDSNFGKDNRS